MAKIDLLKLLKAYEEKLCNKVFHYKTSNNMELDISFYREQFCHLLGIQHIYNRDRSYLGAAGYEKITKKQITIDSLKKHNSKEYEKIKERLIYFDEIYDLMLNGTLISFNSDIVSPRTIIEADFVIYKEHEAHYLHLFLKKENLKTNIYAPISYCVKSFNDKSPKQYIQNQKYKTIIERSIITKNGSV